MPTRYLRPGVRDSKKIDRLSPMAEVLFYRLLVSVDDFGRFDARLTMIRSTCFPLKDGLELATVEQLLHELVAAGLITCYVTPEEKEVLQMQRWENAARSRISRYPAWSEDCAQLYADVRGSHAQAHIQRTLLPGTGTGTGTDISTDRSAGFASATIGGTGTGDSPIAAPASPAPPSAPRPDSENPKTKKKPPKTSAAGDMRFNAFWQAYPSKVGKIDARKAFDKLAPNDELLQRMLEAIANQSASKRWKDGFIPNPSTWLNQGRWDDELQPADGSVGQILAHHPMSKAAIEKDGMRLGVGEWDQAKEQWPAYRARVLEARAQAQKGG